MARMCMSKMIQNKNDLMEYIETDCLANYRMSTECRLYGDKIWKFIICLRKLEYYTNVKSIVSLLFRFWFKYKYNKNSVLLGYSIPINVFEKGVGIPHRGIIVINSTAKIGKNCHIHQGVTIGSTSGSTASATIGDNVFIGANTSIIGDVHIANNVAIGANSLVAKDIDEPGTTWWVSGTQDFRQKFMGSVTSKTCRCYHRRREIICL